ncbi:MAG: hypothetical protein FWB85_12095 [Chitinispirillia bacterium]|nr:hypothetical protein [Chitinispirillia bacterium]MCL2242814.1 hypothetical protein [Chitinispirillia bacterium]
MDMLKGKKNAFLCVTASALLAIITLMVCSETNPAYKDGFVRNYYTLTTDVSPNNSGAVSRSITANSYAEGTHVEITAAPADGWVFERWMGGGIANDMDAAISLEMNANKAVIAVFQQLPRYALSVTATAGGNVSREPEADNYIAGTIVTITAHPPEGYNFRRWTGEGVEDENSQTTTISMTEPRTVTASFEQQDGGTPESYTLITHSSNGGYVSYNPVQETYEPGTVVNIIASPDTDNGYSFSHWSGDGITDHASAATTVTMNDDIVVIAYFVQKKYTLTANANPSEGGGVTRNPNMAEYDHGTPVTLTASPNSGYTFTGWEGACTGNGECVVTMTQERTVTARFETVAADPCANGATAACCAANQSYPGCNQDGTLTDDRDGQTYAIVKIGNQAWMAENLNYNASGSVCYNNSSGNCDLYGRLYNWATVMNGASSSTSSPSGIQGICPSGWHVPSDNEWETLVKYVDPNASGDYSNNAGTKLKSKSRWNGTDEYGFSALPGGYGGSGSYFSNAGYSYSGRWWSATEDDASYAWYRDMNYNNNYVNRYYNYKTNRLSLRCVRD